MSNNEIGQIKGTVYQQSAGKDPENVANALAFTIVANGTVTLLIGSATTPFTQNSRILGVVRVGAPVGAGVVATTPVMVTVAPFGADAAAKAAAVAGGYSSLPLQSSVAADTSTFSIYWYNETGANLLLC